MGLLVFIFVMLVTAFQVWNHNEQITSLTIIVGIGVAVSLYVMVLIHRMVRVIIGIDKRQAQWERDRRADVLNAELEVHEQEKERFRQSEWARKAQEEVIAQETERSRVQERDAKQDKE